MKEDYMETGNGIKRLRTGSRLTQKEFGDLFHVSDKTVSKWERNVSSPDLDTLKAICTHFQVDVNYFFDQNSSIELNSFNKHIMIASALLIPAFLVPLIGYLVDIISNQTVIDIVIVIYMIILSVSALVSLGLIIREMIAVLRVKQDNNGFFYYKGFFLYFALFQIGLILVTSGPMNLYFPYMVYLPAVGVLIYLIRRLRLKMTLDKPAVILLVITCISFIAFIMTPRAAIQPWTQRQAFTIFLALVLIFLRVSVKPQELASDL
ncbi:MAG: helix-turn-helix domain-containing protein [Acholeplasmataceae bacterium]